MADEMTQPTAPTESPIIGSLRGMKEYQALPREEQQALEGRFNAASPEAQTGVLNRWTPAGAPEVPEHPWTHKVAAGVIDATMTGLGGAAGTGLGAATSPVTGPVGPVVGGATGAVIGHRSANEVNSALGLEEREKPMKEDTPILGDIPVLNNLSKEDLLAGVFQGGANAVKAIGVKGAQQYLKPGIQVAQEVEDVTSNRASDRMLRDAAKQREALKNAPLMRDEERWTATKDLLQDLDQKLVANAGKKADYLANKNIPKPYESLLTPGSGIVGSVLTAPAAIQYAVTNGVTLTNIGGAALGTLTLARPYINNVLAKSEMGRGILQKFAAGSYTLTPAESAFVAATYPTYNNIIGKTKNPVDK